MRPRLLVGLLGLWLALVGYSEGFAQPLGAQGSRSLHHTPEEEAEEHAHQPRHGGYFGDADDIFHYEVLLPGSDQLVLYVNDALNRPLDVRELTGRWILNPDAAVPSTGPFTPSEDGSHFLASLPVSNGTDSIHVSVGILRVGEWVEMEFDLPVPSQPQRRP